MVLDDDLIRKNPCSFQLATVVVNDSVTREAITRKQERTFLEFVRNDAHRTHDRRANRLFSLDQNGKPVVALHWQHYFKRICEKYNGIYRTSLPDVTPHVCRHTYYSNMAKRGMNLKTLQYLMGHADVSVTLNMYAHVSFDDVQEEVLRVVKNLSSKLH